MLGLSFASGFLDFYVLMNFLFKDFDAHVLIFWFVLKYIVDWYSLVNILQVGTYFADQYYHVLQQQPDFIYRFYNESSSVIRVDGEAVEKASEIMVTIGLILSSFFLCCLLLGVYM